MPLQKIQFPAGINKERTRYSGEGQWYDCDKVRFRQGLPEKIGGWERISLETFEGVCTSLFSWTTLGGLRVTGVGTNVKFYVEQGTAYYNITPVRATESLTDPFETTAGSSIVEVTDTAGGYTDGDFVTFSGATAVGGISATLLNAEYEITLSGTNTYTIDVGVAATSSATGGGTVTAEYQINIGFAFVAPLFGWGAGTWNSGTWGVTTGPSSLRLWSQANFGEDLIIGFRGGEPYYWDASSGVTTRAVPLSSLSGASNTPTKQNLVFVSDVSRFVFCFGANLLGSSTQDPMLVRWSDQENAAQWTPAATNQAGSLRLSDGSEIVTALQARQEVLVWTDNSLYSLQYVGPPIVWGAQLLGSNLSIASQNAVAYANGAAFWMGSDKFYMYDGRVQPLRCDLRRYVFEDLNTAQYGQVFAGTNESFNEVWWFYCSADSIQIDKYVVYNYMENIWYYGAMQRTAWLDTGLWSTPIAATYSNNIVQHEIGADDNEGSSPLPIEAYVTSSEFDLEGGDRFMFIWRVVPDVTFNGSTAASPSGELTLLPLRNSGSGYNDPASEGGTNLATVIRTATVPVEEFTGQVYTRARGRQLAVKFASSDLGVKWQLGAPRIDLRPDGRR